MVLSGAKSYIALKNISFMQIYTALLFCFNSSQIPLHGFLLHPGPIAMVAICTRRENLKQKNDVFLVILIITITPVLLYLEG